MVSEDALMFGRQLRSRTKAARALCRVSLRRAWQPGYCIVGWSHTLRLHVLSLGWAATAHHLCAFFLSLLVLAACRCEEA